MNSNIQNTKHRIFLVFISFLFTSVIFGQNKTDEKEILSLCFNISDVQELLDNRSKDINNIIVMQHPVNIPPAVLADSKGREVSYLNKDDALLNGYESYIYFHTFDINNNSGTLHFFYDYDRNKRGEEKRLEIHLEVAKQGKSWTIINQETIYHQ